MKTYLYLIITFMLATHMIGCSGASSFEKDLQQAEIAITNGDMRAAESIVAHITKNGSKITGIPVNQLGRLSLIYMQLADSTNQSENVGLATQCYNQAYQNDADSAEMFYLSVPPEHTRYTMMLQALSNSGHSNDSINLYDDNSDNLDVESVSLL